MSRPDNSIAEQLKAAERRARKLQSFRARLRGMAVAPFLAVVALLRRVYIWLTEGPNHERRRQIRESVAPVLRKIGLYPVAAMALRHARHIRHRLMRRFADKRLSAALRLAAAGPHGYSVICLPVINWRSRFQRPQQLMKLFAERGHRVYYASLGFCKGSEAELTAILPNVYEMALPGGPHVNVYQTLPSPEEVSRMAAAIDRLRREQHITAAVIVIHLPFWTALAETLRKNYGWPIVYDCMDDHSGFSTNSDAMLGAEERTVAAADLVITTSEALRAKVKDTARRNVMIRSACDYDHFSTTPICVQRKPQVTVGYYGAIAEWFDGELAADLALLHPEWKFELIGSTFTGNVTRLKRLPNVALLGEKPYAQLPKLIADWDHYIIPFKRVPLTEATNPAKAYEMLATGKPIVSVNLPELRPMAADGLLALADDAAGFARAIETELAQNDVSRHEHRRAYAAQNTWTKRCDAFDAATRTLFPPASIIIASYNNLDLMRACLASIFHETDYPVYEVIVVDNASHDGTAEWLVEQAAHEPRLRVICNKDNRGYAAANNQGLAIATGEFICLLNNDTVVTPGWLSTLIHRLQAKPRLGMVGPVSNLVGNCAIVRVGYTALDGMKDWAKQYCREHDGESVDMTMLGFFCVVMRREVFSKVGYLDEQFGIGCFEDDDYCRRVLAAGYEMCFVRDAFVHHHHGASFKLLGKAVYQDVFDTNRKKYEEKWGHWEAPKAEERAA